MQRFIILLFIFILSCSSQDHDATESASETFREPQISFNPKQYVCYKSDQKITIDGKMNESIWQHAIWTDDFVDIEGDLKPAPRFRTRVKMLWDDQYFYIFAEMEEPDVWATLKKRDSIIFYDNDFEVFIDPDGDTHRYYELEINAFSTEWDLFLDKPYRDNNKAVFFWDIGGMKSAVHVNGTINRPGDTDNGWNLEIALPWVVLKECADKDAPPKSGDQWRVNFSRVEWQVDVKNRKYQKKINPATGRSFPEDNWVWSPQGLIDMHYPEMWGFVQFSEKIAGTGIDEFEYHQEEDLKWALRQIYYRQRNHYNRSGKYTDDIGDLGLDEMKHDGFQWPPTIQRTTSLFEAIIKSNDGSQQWHIAQDGRVWKK
ncbi:carbohydrate-binding family 9-like protein [candidate division KSB1 bacterium]|nr:carbohydrate-binding family 9-like protein [candidate division KSB1 bacterium]